MGLVPSRIFVNNPLERDVALRERRKGIAILVVRTAALCSLRCSASLVGEASLVLDGAQSGLWRGISLGMFVFFNLPVEPRLTLNQSRSP